MTIRELLKTISEIIQIIVVCSPMLYGLALGRRDEKKIDVIHDVAELMQHIGYTLYMFSCSLCISIVESVTQIECSLYIGKCCVKQMYGVHDSIQIHKYINEGKKWQKKKIGKK